MVYASHSASAFTPTVFGQIMYNSDKTIVVLQGHVLINRTAFVEGNQFIAMNNYVKEGTYNKSKLSGGVYLVNGGVDAQSPGWEITTSGQIYFDFYANAFIRSNNTIMLLNLTTIFWWNGSFYT